MVKFLGQTLKKANDDIETTTGAQAKAIAAQTEAITHANTLSQFNIRDTREVDDPPSAYSSSTTGRKIHFEFKRVSVLGLPSGATGTYCTVITDARWIGTSGGRKNQIAITDSGNIYTRTATANESSWGTWDKLAKESDIPTKLSQLSDDIGANGGSFTEHIDDELPHKFTRSNTTYNYGLALNANGKVVFKYEQEG